jgi:enoyl-CoA hydratase/carnithine racemase
MLPIPITQKLLFFLKNSQLWPRILGPARAKRLVMLGEWVSAEKALDWNMCHEVVPDDKLMDRALEFSKTLAGQNQASLRLNKVLMNRWMFGSGNCCSKDGTLKFLMFCETILVLNYNLKLMFR